MKTGRSDGTSASLPMNFGRSSLSLSVVNMPPIFLPGNDLMQLTPPETPYAWTDRTHERIASHSFMPLPLPSPRVQQLKLRLLSERKPGASFVITPRMATDRSTLSLQGAMIHRPMTSNQNSTLTPRSIPLQTLTVGVTKGDRNRHVAKGRAGIRALLYQSSQRKMRRLGFCASRALL